MNIYDMQGKVAIVTGGGLGKSPQVWLQPGAEMRCGITGLGEQQQRVVAWEDRD